MATYCIAGFLLYISHFFGARLESKGDVDSYSAHMLDLCRNDCNSMLNSCTWWRSTL